MAFTDPQSVTINAVANSLPRVSNGINTGTFRKDDATVELIVSHQYGSRNRRTIRLNHSKYAADPLVSSTNVLRSMGIYVVVDTPIQGYTITEQKQVTDGFMTYMTASSGARMLQLLGGEN